MSDKTFVGLDITGFENTGKYRPVSRVTLMVDDENAYTAGDDTGIELSASCPHATQEMANTLLAQFRGYQYQSFTADAANLDPAAELGDGVTVNGIYSIISQLDDDGRGFPDISSPGEVALEEEYPAAGPMTQEINRQFAETRSTISKTADEIRLEVSNEIEGLSSSFTVQLNSIRSQISGLNGQLSSIEQYVDSITLTVSNGSTSSTIRLKAGSATIASQTIQMNGLVTFTGLSSGTTTIDGGCIKTGLIDAERLNLTGAITFEDLSSSVQNDINDAYSMAQDAQSVASDTASTVSGWTYRGTTYIDGSRLMTGTVMASYLLGGTVGLLDSSERTVGGIDLAYTSSGYGLSFWTSRGGIRIESAGNIWLESNGGGETLGLADGYITCGGDTMPRWDDRLSLGRSSYRWAQVYAASSEIVTSDRNKKNSITYDMAKYDVFFDRLRPSPYKYNNGTSGRTHIGLISQDVEEALAASGLSDMDFAGFVKGQDGNGGFVYSLRYEEFIALCVYQIQELKARVAKLEG